MSTICVDLMHIVEVVNDFLYFLGPDLKTVTGDVQGIDNVIHKVHAMVAPVENLPFDAFDKSHAALWQAVVYQFDQDKGKIEDLTKAFIDTSFKKLRSAEGGSRDWMAHHIFFSTPAQKQTYIYMCSQAAAKLQDCKE
jgi:dynein heavy chain